MIYLLTNFCFGGIIYKNKDVPDIGASLFFLLIFGNRADIPNVSNSTVLNFTADRNEFYEYEMP